MHSYETSSLISIARCFAPLWAELSLDSSDRVPFHISSDDALERRPPVLPFGSIDRKLGNDLVKRMIKDDSASRDGYMLDWKMNDDNSQLAFFHIPDRAVRGGQEAISKQMKKFAIWYERCFDEPSMAEGEIRVGFS